MDIGTGLLSIVVWVFLIPKYEAEAAILSQHRRLDMYDHQRLDAKIHSNLDILISNPCEIVHVIPRKIDIDL